MEMMLAAMHYSHTEALRAVFREAESLCIIGILPNLILAQVLGTVARELLGLEVKEEIGSRETQVESGGKKLKMEEE